jgi:hypothetical protein
MPHTSLPIQLLFIRQNFDNQLVKKLSSLWGATVLWGVVGKNNTTQLILVIQ